MTGWLRSAEVATADTMLPNKDILRRTTPVSCGKTCQFPCANIRRGAWLAGEIYAGFCVSKLYQEVGVYFFSPYNTESVSRPLKITRGECHNREDVHAQIRLSKPFHGKVIKRRWKSCALERVLASF